MSLSILEQIAANVASTIAGVTTSNGYTHDLTTYRPSKAIQTVKDYTAYVTLAAVDRDDTKFTPYQHAQWLAHFEVLIGTMPQEGDTTAIGTYQNSIRADVEKALMVDPFRNGLALDTLLMGGETLDQDNGGFDGLLIRFDVRFRTLIADPYSQ